MKTFRNVPDWNKNKDYNLDNITSGIDDLNEINEKLISIVNNMRVINNKLMKYERIKVKKAAEYNHKFKNSIIEMDSGTDSRKKLLAEIKWEDEALELTYLDQMIKELTRESFFLRTQLDIVNTMGHNIRREMTL